MAGASPTTEDAAVDMVDAVHERRPSLEKKPIAIEDDDDDAESDCEPAFDRLPDEIIEQILLVTDPNSFASLVLINSKWRRVSQQAHLYAHHLSKCPSYAASHPKVDAGTVKDEQLSELRRAFAREVKRCLFDAYLRPSETRITLVSNSISSSSCPGGEGMQFSPSPKGHHLLAYNSSRIYVIDVRGPSIEVKRELKILRRPVSTCIKDDGTLLVVLSTEMQVDIYDLEKSPPKRVQSIILDHSPRTVALSPCGSVLAAAYEGGIEVSSLNPSAVATERRAVKCDGVDSLAFSFDGTQLLGTTVHSLPSNTVVLTAPYYDPGSHMADDNISALWTTSILFPNTSRDCSHAVLIQDSSHEEAAWTFTYDRSFETFRAVRIDDLRNGTTYFTGPIPKPTSQGTLLPCTLPTATYHGELVSAGFQGKEVWLYGVPEDLDAVPNTASSSSTDSESAGAGLGRRNSSGLQRTPSRIQDSAGARVPQWQLLCDKLRNTFVSGSKVAELEGVSNVKWIAGFGDSVVQERLVIAARGVNPSKPITEEDDIDFIDGGRITLLDFDYGLTNGDVTEMTIDVGTREPEVLEEEQRDLATEVAIVRRRTVAQRRGGARSSLLRSATTAASREPPLPPPPAPPREDENDDDDPLQPRRIGAPPSRAPARTGTPIAEDGETSSLLEEALDAPYSHASPRSGTTLRRAATAAAANRRLHPQPAAGRVEYRRADGRREHPHESDADNWVPPPPPYQKDDPGDLPAFLRHAAISPSDVPATRRASRQTGAASRAASSADQKPPQPQPVNIGHWPAVPPAPPVPRISHPTSASPAPEQSETRAAAVHQRNVSDTTTLRRPSITSTRRPVSSPGWHQDEVDDMYDVSPPDSPRLGPSGSGEVAAHQQQASTPAVPSTTTNEHQPYRVSIRGAYSNPLGLNPTPQDAQRSVSDPSRQVPTVQTQRGGVPALDLHIPSPTLSSFAWGSTAGNGGSHTAPAPGVRRLSNAVTWPGGPTEGTSGDPYSAPARADTYPAMPLLSVSDSFASGSNSNRRPSDTFQVPRVPVGSRSAESGQRSSGQQQLPRTTVPDRTPLSPPDQPLIISTPTGVAGAFDPPTQQGSGIHTDMPLLAPVPQRPRPRPGNGQARPTVETLETNYSTASGGNPPPWLNAPSTSSRQPSLNRRKSRARARRSASKNVKDAKSRGWSGGKGKKKDKKRIDYEVSSSAGWTDVSVPSNEKGKDKEKKCIVM